MHYPFRFVSPRVLKATFSVIAALGLGARAEMLAASVLFIGTQPVNDLSASAKFTDLG